MNNLVSIIIPTYNRAYIISETLDSIIAQTYENWECIVVDDWSTDNTATILNEYIKKDTRFQYHKRPNRIVKGANACRNYGFEISKGDYIQWFDSDDLLEKNAFEKYLRGTTKKEDLIVAPIKTFRKEFNFITEIKVFSNNLIEDYHIGKVSFLTGAAFWSKTFLNKQESLFDETLGNLDDWDFNLRMLYQKPTIKFLKTPLMLYRIHKDSLSHELVKLNIEEIKSEFKAREKHVELLKKTKISTDKLEAFILFRYKVFLRMALVEQHEIKYFLLLKTVKKQLNSFYFFSSLKTFLFSSFYIIFNKGYKYLK